MEVVFLMTLCVSLFDLYVQPGGHGDGRGECWGSSRHVVTKRERATNIRTTRKESARERERENEIASDNDYIAIY